MLSAQPASAPSAVPSMRVIEGDMKLLDSVVQLDPGVERARRDAVEIGVASIEQVVDADEPAELAAKSLGDAGTEQRAARAQGRKPCVLGQVERAMSGDHAG